MLIMELSSIFNYTIEFDNVLIPTNIFKGGVLLKLEVISFVLHTLLVLLKPMKMDKILATVIKRLKLLTSSPTFVGFFVYGLIARFGDDG